MDLLIEVEETIKNEIKNAIIKIDTDNSNQLPEIIYEKTKDTAHGDFATNIAMQLARQFKKAPKIIAEQIVEHFNNEKANIEKIEVAGPGFINFFMKQSFLGDIVNVILDHKEAYGKSTIGNNERIQVEFVSVNPTGDLHLGHARGAAFGDVLCNVLSAAGYEVEREYYINDAGNQIDNLAYSVEARYLQALGQDAAMPEDGYHGQDIIEIGEKLKEEYGDKWTTEDAESRIAFFKKYGLQFELEKIEADLADFRVHFDHWFSEQSLYHEKINEALQVLKDAGYVYEQDGATWLRSTDFGDDKDRVLIKQDGNYTYLTPDIAYHQNKLERGFNKIINGWGAYHHGYIPRMRAAIQALGYAPEKFEVQIIQMVNLFENGQRLRMSKRTGKALALRELMNYVGIDAVRYFFVTRDRKSVV